MRKYLMFIISVALVAFMASSVSAQYTQNQLRNQFRNQYDKTEQVIDRARTIINESRTKMGQELLKLAMGFQNQAREYGLQNNFMIAAKLTLEAREKAHSAIMVNQRTEENENLVVRQLDKTDNLISRIQSRINQRTPKAALRLFDTARQNQRRAREMYRNRELRPALKMSRQAEKVIRGLMERVQSEQGNLKRLRLQFEKIEQRMENIRNLVGSCDNDEAAKYLNRAAESYKKGKNLLKDGKLKQAENNMKKIQKTLRLAENLCADQTSIEREIAKLKQNLNRISEMAIGSENETARELINSAREHLRKAEQLCAAGDVEGCAANVKVAQISLRKAKELLG